MTEKEQKILKGETHEAKKELVNGNSRMPFIEEDNETARGIEDEVDKNGAPVDRGWAWVILAGSEINAEEKSLLRQNTDVLENIHRNSFKFDGVQVEANLFCSDNKLNHKKFYLAKSNDSTHLQICKQKSVEQAPKGSPLLQRVRANSVGVPQKIFSEHITKYDSERNVNHRKNALKGVIDAISRSQVALYSSSDGISGSFADIDMQSTKNTQTDYVPKGDKKNKKSTNDDLRCCSYLKSLILSILCTVLDFELLHNPVFITYLFMAFSIMSGLSLVPIYMPAHAKDIGVSNEKIRLLISFMMIIDLISKVMVGVIVDRKFISTPTVFVIVAIVMGTTSHLLRYINSFSTMVIFVVITGICCGQYISLFGVLLMVLLGPSKFKSSLGFGMLINGLTVAIFFPVVGMKILFLFYDLMFNLSPFQKILIGLLRDITGSYVASYNLLGALTYLGGLLAFLIPVVDKRKKSTETKNRNGSIS